MSGMPHKRPSHFLHCFRVTRGGRRAREGKNFLRVVQVHGSQCRCISPLCALTCTCTTRHGIGRVVCDGWIARRDCILPSEHFDPAKEMCTFSSRNKCRHRIESKPIMNTGIRETRIMPGSVWVQLDKCSKRTYPDRIKILFSSQIANRNRCRSLGFVIPASYRGIARAVRCGGG